MVKQSGRWRIRGAGSILFQRPLQRAGGCGRGDAEDDSRIPSNIRADVGCGATTGVGSQLPSASPPQPSPPPPPPPPCQGFNLLARRLVSQLHLHPAARRQQRWGRWRKRRRRRRRAMMGSDLSLKGIDRTKRRKEIRRRIRIRKRRRRRRRGRRRRGRRRRRRRRKGMIRIRVFHGGNKR